MHFDKPTYSVRKTRKKEIPEGLYTKDPVTGEILFNKEIEDNQMVVPKSGHHFPIGARERIARLLDPDSFTELHGDVRSSDPLNFVDSQPYPERIMPEWLFWSVVGILVAIGVVLVLRANLPNENRIAHVSARFVEGCQDLIRRLPIPPAARRVVVLIIGCLVLLIGVAMIFLPGPAVIVIPAGLAILATEFQWAQNLLDKGRNSVRKVLHRA